MAEERINRKLAAILAADVVGYSRLMASDEAGTLGALKRHRQTVFEPAVAAHQGRIVKLIGDGTIVEFASVVDAVNCALSVQRSGDSLQDESLPQPKIVLRIGINLGDVIIEGDDIYGEGVNIAARLEPAAEPGGICISSIVNESIGNRIDVHFQDGGQINVKNIDRPVRIWRWHPSTAHTKVTSGPESDTANPRPHAAIAILPFTNMSGDPEQEYFSDGISEDIITDLSKIADLMVIARNSSFAYKGRSVDVRTIGHELGVQSVLEGSIRRSGNRLRITAQLIDVTSGGHLWADRYDRDLADIFEGQDDVRRRIVDALKVKLSPAEKKRLGDTKTPHLAAYDYALRGREFLLGKEKNRETFEEAIMCFKKALEHDPNYSIAYARLGIAHIFDYVNRYTDDPNSSLPLAKQSAREALEKDPNEPLARCSWRWPLRSKGTSTGQSLKSALRCHWIPILFWLVTFVATIGSTPDTRWKRYPKSSRPCVLTQLQVRDSSTFSVWHTYLQESTKQPPPCSGSELCSSLGQIFLAPFSPLPLVT